MNTLPRERSYRDYTTKFGEFSGIFEANSQGFRREKKILIFTDDIFMGLASPSFSFPLKNRRYPETPDRFCYPTRGSVHYTASHLLQHKGRYVVVILDRCRAGYDKIISCIYTTLMAMKHYLRRRAKVTAFFVVTCRIGRIMHVST